MDQYLTILYLWYKPPETKNIQRIGLEYSSCNGNVLDEFGGKSLDPPPVSTE